MNSCLLCTRDCYMHVIDYFILTTALCAESHCELY